MVGNGEPRRATGARRRFFAGQERRRLDQANRIILPAKWRGRSDDEIELYVVPTVGRPSLTVMPPEVVERIYEKLDELKLGDADRWDFIRMYGARMTPSGCDGQGRMTLARDHIQYAGLDGEIVLVGLITQFEIWDPARFAKFDEARWPQYEETARQLGV